MRVVLLSVGRPRDAAASEIHDRYAGRLARLGLRYRAAFVPETAGRGRLDEPHVRRRDTARLLESAEPGTVVALDRRGEALDTPALAARLERWATPALTLLVGGPLGLDPESLSGVDARWSLSPLTYPHELVRGIVAEQIYRAMTILRGVPYHK